MLTTTIETVRPKPVSTRRGRGPITLGELMGELAAAELGDDPGDAWRIFLDAVITGQAKRRRSSTTIALAVWMHLGPDAASAWFADWLGAEVAGDLPAMGDEWCSTLYWPYIIQAELSALRALRESSSLLHQLRRQKAEEALAASLRRHAALLALLRPPQEAVRFFRCAGLCSTPSSWESAKTEALAELAEKLIEPPNILGSWGVHVSRRRDWTGSDLMHLVEALGSARPPVCYEIRVHPEETLSMILRGLPGQPRIAPTWLTIATRHGFAAAHPYKPAKIRRGEANREIQLGSGWGMTQENELGVEIYACSNLNVKEAAERPRSVYRTEAFRLPPIGEEPVGVVRFGPGQDPTWSLEGRCQVDELSVRDSIGPSPDFSTKERWS